MSSEEPNDYRKTIENFQKKNLKSITITLLILISIHLILVFKFLPKEYAENHFWAIDIFWFTVTILGFWGISNRFKKKQGSFIKAFLTYSTFKIFSIVLFFSFWAVLDEGFTRPILYQFLWLFFPLLFIETMALIKMVNLPFDEKFEKS